MTGGVYAGQVFTAVEHLTDSQGPRRFWLQSWEAISRNSTRYSLGSRSFWLFSDLYTWQCVRRVPISKNKRGNLRSWLFSIKGKFEPSNSMALRKCSGSRKFVSAQGYHRKSHRRQSNGKTTFKLSRRKVSRNLRPRNEVVRGGQMMKFLIPTPYEFHNKKWNPNGSLQIKEGCTIPATLW